MKARLLFSLFLLGLATISFGQKIAAYLPDYRDPSPTAVQYTKLTHVLYSFVNPNSTGNLVGINTPNIGDANYDFNINNFLVARSQCYPVKPDGPKLVISVGGADAGNVRANNLNNVSANATYRATMISQLVAFALKYNLEGIDIDWEFPTTAGAKANHKQLLVDLRAAITASANPYMKIGIAIGGETTGGTNHTQYLDATVIPYVDDFNIMAYDLPAAYDVNNHAPLGAMQTMINNWATFGIPRSKMVLGLPFYGRTPARSATGGEYKFIVSTAANADIDGPTSGFYYNGRPTLRSKVDLIMNSTNCGQGVMIWDIGQDRTDALSLLNAVYDRMTTTACSLAEPNLGSDANYCSGTTTLTATGTPAASGRTFEWKRNGAVVTTTTTNTYGITQGGTWTVTVTDGCCKRNDEIIITAGKTVTGTPATRCGTGTLNLGASGGTTYDWYSASTEGQYLNAGSSFTTPSISTTTTYYVQERATPTTTIYTGKGYPGAGPLNEFGAYTNSMAHWGNRMTVGQTLTIKSVNVYYSGPALTNVRLVAYNGTDGTTVDYQSAGFNLPLQTVAPAGGAGFPVTLNTNLTLPPGTYYLGIYAPGATAPPTTAGITCDPSGSATPYSQGTLFSINAQANQNWGSGFSGAPSTRYGQIFDWVIEVAGNPCGRTAVQAIINCPPTVTLTSPAPPGPVSGTVGTPFTLTATASDDGSITGVVYEIRNTSTNALITTVTGGAGPNYTASWTPASNIQYTVTAIATDNTSLTGSSAAVVVDASILPVNWLSFEAKKQNGDVYLTWSTASETNSNYFVVERSSDRINFSTVGQINSAGNSNSVQNYLFTDAEPLAGTSYYRLVQYDTDGSFTLSEIKVIKDLQASLSPNPFSTSLSVLVNNSGAYKIKVSTLQGLLVLEEDINDGSTVYSIGESLSPGVYMLSITSPEGSVVYRIEKIN